MSDTATIEKSAGIGHNSAAVGEMVKEDPAIIFRDEATLPALMKEIDGEIGALRANVETESGRKAIASLAYSISRRKTPILDAGKALTEDWRKKTATVNALKSKVETEFDKRRDTAREPLTKWEKDEEARDERVSSALVAFANLPVVPAGATVEDVDCLMAQVEAVTIDEGFRESKDRATTAKAEALSKLLDARTAIIRADDERAELARLRALQEERDRAEREAAAKRQAEEAEQARIAEAQKRAAAEAEERVRAEAERQVAEERRKAEAAAQALADEQRRQREAAEAQGRRAAEAAAEESRRQADVAHRGAVMRTAKEALMDQAGLDEPTAKKVVLAIVNGSIPSVTLKF